MIKLNDMSSEIYKGVETTNKQDQQWGGQKIMIP